MFTVVAKNRPDTTFKRHKCYYLYMESKKKKKKKNGCCLVTKSFLTLCDSMDCPWHFPGKNTGVGFHFLLQGIFQTQGLNPCLLHWILLQLSYLGNTAPPPPNGTNELI